MNSVIQVNEEVHTKAVLGTDHHGVVDGGHLSGGPLLPAAERHHVVKLHDAVVVLSPPSLRLPFVEYLPATQVVQVSLPRKYQ
jgi:hypothetical protein